MVVKVAMFFCSVAAVLGAPLARLEYNEPEPSYPAQYEYSYSVQDDHSGDVKQQKENRNGDTVHGSYSFVQPDGTVRIVEYTADKEHGFNAVVRYEGQPHAHVPAPPKVNYVAAPIPKAAYVAPAKLAYAAPTPAVHYNAQPYRALAQLAYPSNQLVYQQPAPFSLPAAQVAKVAYNAPIGQVSYASPAYSYHH